MSISLPFHNPELARAMEPYVATPQRRLQTIERLAEAGIPVGVTVAPIIPGLNDEDIARVLDGGARGRRHAARATCCCGCPGPVKAGLRGAAAREAAPARRARAAPHPRDARRASSTTRASSTACAARACTRRPSALFETTARRVGLNNAWATEEEEKQSPFRRPMKPGTQLSFF